uniref:Uncharacterized protein n=1 Tax=Micrococcus phage Kurnik TaxID=3092208 RepID=A0AAU6R643_9CAUD
MEIVIADHSRTDLDIEVHSADCSHQERLVNRGYTVGDPMDYDTRAEVFFDYNADFYEEGGKDACHHLAFKPCTKDLPNGVWPEEFGIKPAGPRDPKLTLIEAAMSAGEAAHQEALATVEPHGLYRLDTIESTTDRKPGPTTWTCACGKTGTSQTEKLAKEGHRAHVRKAAKA